MAYLAALDLVCSDGTTVLDPGPNTTFRASLAFNTTPVAPSGGLISQASAAFAGSFTDFKADTDANIYDMLLNCSSGYGFLGATVKHWTAGSGAPGDNYTDTIK